MSYTEKLKDPRWQKKRLGVMQRDGFACRDCGSENKTLNVHHCAYVGLDPWDAPESVMLTLCQECHKARQSLENRMHLLLGVMMAKQANDDCGGDRFSDLECLSIEIECAQSFGSVRISEGANA